MSTMTQLNALGWLWKTSQLVSGRTYVSAIIIICLASPTALIKFYNSSSTPSTFPASSFSASLCFICTTISLIDLLRVKGLVFRLSLASTFYRVEICLIVFLWLYCLLVQSPFDLPFIFCLSGAYFYGIATLPNLFSIILSLLISIDLVLDFYFSIFSLSLIQFNFVNFLILLFLLIKPLIISLAYPACSMLLQNDNFYLAPARLTL